MPLLSTEQYHDILNNKRVVLVGPSANSTMEKNGEAIDDFDIIVRIKSVYVPLKHHPYIGSKTHFTYSTSPQEDPDIEGNNLQETEPPVKKLHLTPEELKKIEFQGFCSTYPRGEWFFNRLESGYQEAKKNFAVRIMDDEPYLTIKKQVNRPNSGFSAIIDLLEAPLKELYITGLDFHRSLYREDYRNSHWNKDTIENMTNDPDGTDTHLPDRQFRYFKYEMYKKDPRIIPDKFLKHFLENDKYENCLRTLQS
jgi:hypothetical protein